MGNDQKPNVQANEKKKERAKKRAEQRFERKAHRIMILQNRADKLGYPCSAINGADKGRFVGPRYWLAAARLGLRGKWTQIGIVVVILCMLGLFLQNSNMIEQMNKILGESDMAVHEIYDDTAVVKAYKSEDTADDDRLSAEDKYVLDQAREIIDEVIKPDMTPYEMEKAIYDWQVAWVNYQEANLSPIQGGGNDTHLPYGVLRSHQAICVGNATTFKLFMDILDIPCQIIHSTESGEHAWNIVQLDGEWYHVDVTFDGTTDEKPDYAYFNVPDSVKDDGSWPWDHNEIPAANGTKYCYLLHNAPVLDDLYAIPQGLAEAISEGKGKYTFMLKDNDGFNAAVSEFIANNMIVEDGSVYYEGTYAIDGKTIYCYSIAAWDEGEGIVDDDVAQRLSEIIAELQGGDMADEDGADDEPWDSWSGDKDAGNVTKTVEDGDGGGVAYDEDGNILEEW